jgi:hypothetical protein
MQTAELARGKNGSSTGIPSSRNWRASRLNAMRRCECYSKNVALGMENNPLRIARNNEDDSSTDWRGNVHTTSQNAARRMMLLVRSLIVGVIRSACPRKA